MNRANLGIQLVDATMREGRHVTPRGDDVYILTDQGAKTPAQVRWFLDTGDWVEEDEIESDCGHAGCIQHLVVPEPDQGQQPPGHQDPFVGQLMQQYKQDRAVRLASLFTQGRAKGLLQGISRYGGSK